ncbi:MAG TPA: DUF494 family protein [Candidatus Cloacimonadota bacterium]|jgi:uncharacterized protein Smg (DUF494 family)|nr:DUF494 family protein [Candidatus Cloacimonadota bacterium]HQB41156.1 DUF494 family protein [Candidatus Cloacimonadota bacterium]
MKKEESLKALIDKIKKIEELSGDKLLKDNKAIERLINKHLSKTVKNLNNRIMSEEEKMVLTPEAFSFLLSMVDNNSLNYNEFEMVVNSFTQYSYEIDEPIDEISIILLLEMISLAGYDETVMDKIIQMYINTPGLLNKIKYTTH